jgi:hypothetical protein
LMGVREPEIFQMIFCSLAGDSKGRDVLRSTKRSCVLC